MNLQCLVDNGTITQEQADLIASMPNGNVALQVIAGLLMEQFHNTNNGPEVISSEWLSGVTSATNQVLSVPSGTTGALITPYDGDIYFTIDGTNPASAEAHYLSEKATLDIKNPAAFRFSAESATVTAYVTYYK